MFTFLYSMSIDQNSVKTKSLYFLIVNYNSSNLVARLINSLNTNYQEKHQIVIINNSAADQEIYNLENHATKIIETKENLGFGKACNVGLHWISDQDSEAIIWLINPDAYFNSDVCNIEISSTLSGMSQTSSAIAFFKNHPQISILGTTIYDSQGVVTSAGGTFNAATGALSIITSLPEDIKEDYIKFDWVSGCSLLINLANFAECPNFDPRYFLYYEDLDFCLRYGQQGHQVAVTHLIKVMHDTSSITNRNIWKKYQYITQSYLIHMEKYGSLPIFILTNIRMSLNTIRLIIFNPQQGIGKLIGIFNYWQARLIK